jgi:hypothetical protein
VSCFFCLLRLILYIMGHLGSNNTFVFIQRRASSWAVFRQADIHVPWKTVCAIVGCRFSYSLCKVFSIEVKGTGSLAHIAISITF